MSVNYKILFSGDFFMIYTIIAVIAILILKLEMNCFTFIEEYRKIDEQNLKAGNINKYILPF